MMNKLHQLSFALILALFSVLGLILTSCVSQTPTPQYADNLVFAVAYVHDNTADVTSAPISDGVSQDLTKVLTDRNLSVQAIGFSSIEGELKAIRDTERRIQALQASSQDAEFILLTELNTEFYSTLSGRYRWDVNARITIYDRITRTTISDSFTVPAVLMYAHEDGDDAIASVEMDIEKHTGSLVDRFLAGRVVNASTRHARPQAPPVSPEPPAPVSTEPAQPPAADPPNEPMPDTVQPADNPENNEASLDGGASPIPQAIYFILIDRFFNAQNNNDLDSAPHDPAGWHGGDLEGIRQKLPYLSQLGFTQIWISPAFLTASEKFFGNAAFHGYWTYDLNQIDPHFGNESDLKKLALDAQNHHIGIILDFVVNHVGYGSPWLELKPNWFHPDLTIEDWNDPDQLVNRQVHGLPDLDQDNPEVYQYIIHAANQWLSIPNITGLRLDAVKHVSIDFWKKFNTSLISTHKNTILLGEYFDGDPKKVNDIQKNGHFTHLFDFPLAFALRDVFCSNRSLAALASTIANDREYTSPNQMVTFIDNHDMPRFISLCNQDYQAMERALKVLLSWRGVPSIYYGTEIPLPGNKEPDNRADMTFDQGKYHHLIQSALEQRKQHPVLSFGTTAVLSYEKDFMAIIREYKNEKALILISQNSKTKHYTLPQGLWSDISNPKRYTQSIDIKPKSVQILIQNDQNKSLIQKTTYRVDFILPNDGKTYALPGSMPEMAHWDPNKAPQSNTKISLNLPAQTVIVYKPVIINGNDAQWADGDNRELFIDGNKTIHVGF